MWEKVTWVDISRGVWQASCHHFL